MHKWHIYHQIYLCYSFPLYNVSFTVEIKGINCLQTQVMQKPQSANQAPMFRFTVSTLNGNEYVFFASEEKKKL